MKKLLLLAFILLIKPSFSQEVIRVNFEKECIIRGGQLYLDDFKKMKYLCPEGFEKVNSYVISYKSRGNIFTVIPMADNSNFQKKMGELKQGMTIIFDKITGTASGGKSITSPRIEIHLN